MHDKADSSEDREPESRAATIRAAKSVR
jgi:hypothetical protein